MMKEFNFLPSIEVVKTKRDKHISIYNHHREENNNTISQDAHGAHTNEE